MHNLPRYRALGRFNSFQNRIKESSYLPSGTRKPRKKNDFDEMKPSLPCFAQNIVIFSGSQSIARILFSSPKNE
jgi:hypothetical protein